MVLRGVLNVIVRHYARAIVCRNAKSNYSIGIGIQIILTAVIVFTLSIYCLLNAFCHLIWIEPQSPILIRLYLMHHFAISDIVYSCVSHCDVLNIINIITTKSLGYSYCILWFSRNTIAFDMGYFKRMFDVEILIRSSEKIFDYYFVIIKFLNCINLITSTQTLSSFAESLYIRLFCLAMQIYLTVRAIFFILI